MNTDQPTPPKKTRWGLWAAIGAIVALGLYASASGAPGGSTPTPSYTQTAPATQNQTLSNDNYYVNSSGNTVHSPAYTSNGSVPAGASAQCRDGTYSFSQHRSGTCSHHGGVATWY